MRDKNKNRKQGRLFTERVNSQQQTRPWEPQPSKQGDNSNAASCLQQFVFVLNFVFACDFIVVFLFVFAFASNSRAMETSSLWQQKLGAHICLRLYQQGEKNTFGKPVTRLPELWLHPGPSSIQLSWVGDGGSGDAMHAVIWETTPIQCNYSIICLIHQFNVKDSSLNSKHGGKPSKHFVV